MLQLSRDEARALMVFAQRLGDPPEHGPTKQDVLELIRLLGCVQIDTISVVARSQYLVIWSRLGRYQQEWLDELLFPDRAVFEYWAHAASIIPVELYPYFRRRMLEFWQRNGYHHEWTQENSELLEQIRLLIRERGPVSSSHFERPEGAGPVAAWSWWGGKPANRALDVLWSAGELGIQRRVNFQRHYDFAERLYPEFHADELPSLTEEQRVLARIAVRALGITAPRWLNDYFRTRWGVRGHHKPGPDQILASLAEAGDLIPVEVEDIGTAYVAAENRDRLEAVRSGSRPSHTTLLSPFDSLVWDRARALELFDFDYRLECYTPAPKRRYGYFTMPILHRGRLVGRLEPKVDRKRRVFSVRSLHLEPGVSLDAPLVRALGTVLDDFASFNGADILDLDAVPAFAEALEASGNGR